MHVPANMPLDVMRQLVEMKPANDVSVECAGFEFKEAVLWRCGECP